VPSFGVLASPTFCTLERDPLTIELAPLEIWVPGGKDESRVLLYSSLDHQSRFHYGNEPNILMEGGRGTGKSLAIRMDAHARAMQWPGFQYLVLRRTMPELRKSHFHDVEIEMKKLGGFFHKTDNQARYENGSVGYFGHCETSGDILNYLSAQFGAIYFDELSTFTLDMFLQISSSARAPEDAPYTAIVRGGTNPIGEGAGWVKQWFIDKTVDLAEYQDYNPDDFVTISSVYTDNPHLNQTAYKARLSSLPKHVRDAWLEGIWKDPDSYFSDWTPSKLDEAQENYSPWHIIDDLPLIKGKPLLEQPWLSIYRAYDDGFSPDPAVCLWIAVLPNGQAIVFKERQWLQTTSEEIAKDIVRESAGMRIVETVCDPMTFAGSKATAGYSRGDIMEANGVPLTASTNDRHAAGFAIHEYLNTVIDGQPKLQVLRDGAPNLIRTLPQMRQDKNNPTRIADGEDHYVIALGYFAQSYSPGSKPPGISSIPRWMQTTKTKRIRLGAESVRRK
jgi:hypothetical protein